MEIGQELDRSHRTIEIHRGRVIEKLEAKNTAHAIAIGFVSGILTGEDLEEG
jgi:DNA-binding CsgD family transcriptional regulator